MLAAILLAATILQESPPARVADAAVFEELIRKTNDLKAFVAVYRVRGAERDPESKIRITYRAPAELRVEEVGKLITQVVDGVFEMSLTLSDGSGSFARTPIAKSYQEFRDRLGEAVRSEFPTSNASWDVGPQCGVILKLEVHLERSSREKAVGFGCTYGCRRRALLYWLNDWRDSGEARFEGEDHLVREIAPRTRLKLSARNGFVERCESEREGHAFLLELESLDLDPKLDPDAIAPIQPGKDAMDGSLLASDRYTGSIIPECRSELLTWISARVADKSIAWDSASRERVRKVFDRFHADAVVEENRGLADFLEKAIEMSESRTREAFEHLDKSDAAGRSKLRAGTDKERKVFADVIGGARAARAARLHIDRGWVPDAALRGELGEIEKAAADAAFERLLEKPLLQAFDERLSKARGGG